MSMKIIHNNNLGFHYGNRFKLGENPISTVISGIFGIGETEMTNETNEQIAKSQIQLQQEENQKNRDYNTLEAEKARQHEINMIRETPSLQVQGMRQAGINPQVALSNSTQVATGGSSGTQQASYSGGLSPVPYQAQNPANAFAQVAQGLSSLATAKEKGANVGLIEKQVENMAIDSQMKKALTDGYKLSNELQKLDLKYRDKKLLQDIQEQVVRMAATTAQGKLFTEQSKIQQSIEDLNRNLASYHGQNADYLKLKIANYTVELNSVLKLNAAQTKAANASAVESMASAHYKNQLAETEKKLREGTIEMQSLHNDLLTLDKFIKGNQQKISDATFEAQLFATMEQLYREGLISENVYKEGQILSVKRDWASRQEFANYMRNVVGAAADATNSYANVRGVQVRRLNAKERNQIQSRFVDEFRQRGLFERENKINYRESGDAFPMYMPYD